MITQTGLYRRNAVYHLRRKVPADLRSLYIKKEIHKSLGTKDPKEARQRLHEEWTKLDQEFERRRASRDAPLRTTITDEEIQRLAALAVATRLQADEEGRMLGLSDEAFEQAQHWLEDSEQRTMRGATRGDFSGWLPQIEDWLLGHGFDLSPDSEQFKRFAYEFVRAQAKANAALRERQRGNPVETPKAEPFNQTTKDAGVSDTLDDLLDYWKSQTPRKPKTLHEFSTAVNRFTALHGKAAAKHITRSQVVKFKDDLLVEKKLAPGTVKKQLGALSAILQMAVDNDKLPFNPARGVKVVRQKVEKKARVAFDAQDLKRIFASPVFSAGLRPEGGAGEAAYWIPIIAALHGARLEEIGQLSASDVRKEAGITYLRITNEAEGASVKTVTSRRRVPIHPVLLRLGFLDYVKLMQQSSDGRLFPKLKADRMGIRTGNWSKWWGRYMRTTIQITDPRKTFHSFRHTFKDACREAGINPEIHDSLTGHAPNANEGRSYGGEDYPLKPLAAAMKKLKLAGVEQLLRGGAVAPDS